MSAIMPLRVPIGNVSLHYPPPVRMPIEAVAPSASREVKSIRMERSNELARGDSALQFGHKFTATAGVDHYRALSRIVRNRLSGCPEILYVQPDRLTDIGKRLFVGATQVWRPFSAGQ